MQLFCFFSSYYRVRTKIDDTEEIRIASAASHEETVDVFPGVQLTLPRVRLQSYDQLSRTVVP